MKCLIIYFILLYIFIVYNFQVTEQKLKEIFSEKGIVTDVQLKYTPDGKFRRFGFVGYQTEEEASAAVNYFNNTCIKYIIGCPEFIVIGSIMHIKIIDTQK